MNSDKDESKINYDRIKDLTLGKTSLQSNKKDVSQDVNQDGSNQQKAS